MSSQHTQGPLCAGTVCKTSFSPFAQWEWGAFVHVGEEANRGNAVAIVHMGGPGAIHNDEESVAANAARIVQCWNNFDELSAIVKALSLATDEGDDKSSGTHYIDKQGVIRCKGSFLELIERARAALEKAGI